MNEYEKVQNFVERMHSIEIPNDRIDRARLFAKECALGVKEGLWFIRDIYNQDNARRFYTSRWGDLRPDGDLLRTLGYVTDRGDLAKPALDLLNEATQTSIFISYSRADSSALALLAHHTLKTYQVESFVDMAIEVGDEWHKDLETRVLEADCLISIIGRTTLDSRFVRAELEWAFCAGKKVYPMWHNGFDGEVIDQQLKYEAVTRVLSIQAIKIERESAANYQLAMIQMLNKFGITL